MKYVVNDIAAMPNAGGVYSILKDFYMDVLKNDHHNEWIFILADKFFPESDNVKIISRPDLKNNKLKKFYFERFSGRKFINKLAPDIYISLQNIATYGINAPIQIVYLHQPIPFQTEKNFSFLKKDERKLAFYQYLVGDVIKKSISKVKPKVIVQTKWMKKAVLEQTESKDIYIKHPKINFSESNSIFNGDGNLFVYPASNYIYKNHEVINNAIKILHKEKVDNFKVLFTLKPDQLDHRDRNIQYIGHIDRVDVMKLYHSHVLLFPSYIESFGLPLIEAAVHADIILAADTTFSRELLANYNNVYFYKYNSADQLAELMKRVIDKTIVSDMKKINVKDNGQSVYNSIKEIVNES